jgi:hypothetical protein
MPRFCGDFVDNDLAKIERKVGTNAALGVCAPAG